jgi:large subunit ribosomal protein L28
MARKCAISGKGVMSGNNVSHANNKTRRRFLPNLQNVSFYSEILKKRIPMRVTVSAVRDVEHKGGFDAYLLNTAPTKLDPKLRKVRRQILKVKEAA